MKVYIVEEIDNYDGDSWIDGVYSTREKAEQYILKEAETIGISCSSYEEYKQKVKELDEDGYYRIKEWNVE